MFKAKIILKYILSNKYPHFCSNLTVLAPAQFSHKLKVVLKKKTR